MIRIAAAAAALMLATAGAAAAEPFDTFTDLCVQTDAKPGAVAAAVAALGWTTVSDEAAARMGEAGVRDPAVHLSFDPAKGPPAQGEVAMATTGWGLGAEMLETMAVDSDTCMVLLAGADVEALRTGLEGLFPFAPATRLEGDAVWLASRDGAGFRSEAALSGAGDPAVVAAVNDRRIYFALLIDDDPSLPGLVFGALRPK